jgi:ABC-type transporter Mla subunit MlaD
MAERMAQAIEKMEARQEAMNAQSTAFVEQIRQLVASSQSETNTKLQATLETIGTQVAGMLATLSESQAKVFEGNRSREQSMTDRAKSAVSSMSESVEAAIKEMSAASAQMAQNVAVLTQTTSSSVDKMNAGAEQLGTASRNFATAGERVTSVMGQAANVTAKLSETSGALTAGASALQELLRDYKTQRDAVGQLVSELRATVELARKEASLTGDVLARIESSATRLGTAQKQADEYLAGVSRVLGEAHTTFATEVKRTLEKANTEFHNKLSGAVGLLSSGVQELEVTLAAMGNMKQARV